MARDGSGTYTLPAGNPVVAGTAISPTTHNSTMNDIASELTNSVDKGGRTAMTGNLPMGGYKLTGLAAGSSANDSVRLIQVPVAAEVTVTLAASATDIGAQVTAHHIILDGTGITVTAFAASTVGYWKRVRFNGVNTLTHGASFALPGSANVTTASGDEADFHYTSAGWKCTAYYRVSGLAVVETGAAVGSWKQLYTASMAGASTVDLKHGTGGVVLDSTYDEYELTLARVVMSAAGAEVLARTSTDAGSNWDVGGSDYKTEVELVAGGIAICTSTTSSSISTGLSANSTANVGGLNVKFSFMNPSAASQFHLCWLGSYMATGATTSLVLASGAGVRLTTADVTGIRFLTSSGTFTSGTVRLFGRKL